jgi:hypothetical protein
METNRHEEAREREAQNHLKQAEFKAMRNEIREHYQEQKRALENEFAVRSRQLKDEMGAKLAEVNKLADEFQAQQRAEKKTISIYETYDGKQWVMLKAGKYKLLIGTEIKVDEFHLTEGEQHIIAAFLEDINTVLLAMNGTPLLFAELNNSILNHEVVRLDW